jgi:hypothetical protein
VAGFEDQRVAVVGGASTSLPSGSASVEGPMRDFNAPDAASAARRCADDGAPKAPTSRAQLLTAHGLEARDVRNQRNVAFSAVGITEPDVHRAAVQHRFRSQPHALGPFSRTIR